MISNQQLKEREKPRYYATDFPEILEKISDEKRELYLKYQKQFNGIGKDSFRNDSSSAGSFGNNPSSDGSFGNDPSSDDPSGKVTLAQLRKITEDAIREIPKQPVNIRVTCPACGKRHCYVRRTDGAAHCFSCGWGGQLDELKALSKKYQHGTDGKFYSETQKPNGKNMPENYVPMNTDDYKEIDAATRSCLYPVYPFDNAEEQAKFMEHFHPANVTQRNPKAKLLLTPERLLSLQGMVQRYIQAMKLSPEVIRKEGVMCAWIMQPVNNGEREPECGKGQCKVRGKVGAAAGSS